MLILCLLIGSLGFGLVVAKFLGVCADCVEASELEDFPGC